MLYKEIEYYDIRHNPKLVDEIIADNANHFSNDLYILCKGNQFQFSEIAKNDLIHLANKILNYFEKPIDKTHNL